MRGRGATTLSLFVVALMTGCTAGQQDNSSAPSISNAAPEGSPSASLSAPDPIENALATLAAAPADIASMLAASRNVALTFDATHPLLLRSAGLNVDVPNDLHLGIRVRGAIDLTVRPPSGRNAARVIAPGVALFSRSARQTNTLVQILDVGPRVIQVIGGARAPTTFNYQMDLPPGTALVALQDGRIVLRSDGRDVVGLPQPWAVDRQGRSIPARYRVDATRPSMLLLDVAHEGASYPVIADPLIIDLAKALGKAAGRWVTDELTVKGFIKHRAKGTSGNLGADVLCAVADTLNLCPKNLSDDAAVRQQEQSRADPPAGPVVQAPPPSPQEGRPAQPAGPSPATQPAVPPPAPQPAAPPQPTSYRYFVYHTCANGACGLWLHEGPGYSQYARARVLVDGDPVDIVCQASGEPVSGKDGSSSPIWDKLADGTWAADFYVSTPGMTGSFSSPIPLC